MELKQINLWGDDFIIPQKRDKEIAKKASSRKFMGEDNYEKQLKSKKTTIEEKLKIISEKVYKKLGHYKDDVEVIRDKDTLHSYITKAIENNILAFDTETNNSLDTVTCKLMGPCLYTPGLKAAYVPINHVDISTGDRLSDQLTEQDVREELLRICNSDVKVIMHNGKFDYEVIYTTCHLEMPLWWDTYISARMLDENERSAGLKQQYIDKIDSDQEKYNIEELFNNILYAQVPPELFALYAAPDAKMTFQLYEWQKAKWESDESLSRMYNLFLNVDVPISIVIAKMELAGICIDFDYAKRLSNKYHIQLEECDKQISEELNKLAPIIDKWRLTPEANQLSTSANSKTAKTLSSKLSSPVNMNSPSQLAILLYDVLKLPAVSKESPRGTGEDILKDLLKAKSDVADVKPLINALLTYRTLSKLVGTFIDKMPAAVNTFDNKIHAEFFNVATNTHRFSSRNPNLQNLPAGVKDIRLLFCGTPDSISQVDVDSFMELNPFDKVTTLQGEITSNKLSTDDILIDIEKNQYPILSINKLGNYIRVQIGEKINAEV